MVANTLQRRFHKERWLGILLAALLLLPLFPLLYTYFNSQHLSFALYGMSKLFCLLFLLEFLFNFSPIQNWKPYLFSLPLGYGFAFFSFLAGFSSYGLFFGLSILIVLSQRYKINTRNKQASTPSSIHPILARILIFALILLPILNIELVEAFRQTSVFFVDRLLDLIGIEFERVGITYFLQTIHVVIEEKCSGSSSTRAFMIIIAALFLYRKAYLLFWTMALPLAILLGLVTNTSRIFLHILYTLQQGQAPVAWLHEALGVFCFTLSLLPVLFYEFKKLPKVSETRFVQTNQFAHLYFKSKQTVVIALVAIVIIASGISLTLYNKYAITKSLTQQNYEGPSIEKYSWVHSYRFREKRGGSGWIFLEHPIEYCMVLAGWNVDGKRVYTNQAGKVLQLNTSFQIGERRFTSRTMALLVKWFDIRTWKQDLKVEVQIQESLPVSNFISTDSLF